MQSSKTVFTLSATTNSQLRRPVRSD